MSSSSTKNSVPTEVTLTKFQRLMVMVCLVVAGEAIFGLPFHVVRFFRPTFLEVFDFTNSELGNAMAMYGILAMLAYFPGGTLADKFSARKLMFGSLLMTALGGLYFATIPSLSGMTFLFGYWGITTILLFWAALIRATREWGGTTQQGLAYGILDGGRGLLAAVIASSAVLVFQSFFPVDPVDATLEQRTLAMKSIILVYSATTVVAAGLVWFFIPKKSAAVKGVKGGEQNKISKADMMQVLRIPAVWFQALIVICAYVAYKGMDNFSLFAVEAYGMNEVEGAGVSAFSAWVRPFAAVGAGLLGDRILSSKVVTLCFCLLLISFLFFGFTTPDPNILWVLFVNIVVTCIAVFGLRGVYFALLGEAGVSAVATGTAVGLVSVIGYTPDIFVAPISGWLLDSAPGLEGHQHLFLFQASFAALGIVASLLFRRFCNSPTSLAN